MDRSAEGRILYDQPAMLMISGELLTGLGFYKFPLFLPNDCIEQRQRFNWTIAPVQRGEQSLTRSS